MRVLRFFGLLLEVRGHEIAERRVGFKVVGFCDVPFKQYLVRVARNFDVGLMQIVMPRAGSKDF